MNGTNWSSAHLAEAVVYTLADSLLLGCFFALITGCLVMSTKRSGAVFRYNALILMLVAFVFSLIVCFFYNWSAGSNAVPADQATGWQHGVKLINEHATVIFRIWFLLTGLQLVKLAFELHTLNRLSKTGVVKCGILWTQKVVELSDVLGIRKVVRLAASLKISSPMVIGFFKPMILVPIALLGSLSASEVEAILLHELAHVRRADFLVNILIRLVRILLSFNPLVWWLCKLIDAEREHCCDDMAVQVTGDKLNYVRALVRFSEQASPSPALAMTLTHGMLGRVERMVTGRSRPLARLELICLSVVLVLGLLVINPYNRSSIVSLARPPAQSQRTGEPPDAAAKAAKEQAERSALKKGR